MAVARTPFKAFQPFDSSFTSTNPDAGASNFASPAATPGLISDSGPATMTANMAPVASTGISAQPYAAPVGTDIGNIAGAGIQAAGQTVGMLAQLAGQKAARDAQLAQNVAGRALSEKLAKMQLAQNADQFGKQQNLAGLMWTLGADKAARDTGTGGRDLRRQDQQMLSDLLARLYMKKH